MDVHVCVYVYTCVFIFLCMYICLICVVVTCVFLSVCLRIAPSQVVVAVLLDKFIACVNEDEQALVDASHKSR